MGLRCYVLGLLAVAVFNRANGASIQQCSFSNADTAVEHLIKCITFQTISATAATGAEEFRGLNSWLADAYADVWRHLRVEQVRLQDVKLFLINISHIAIRSRTGPRERDLRER